MTNQTESYKRPFTNIALVALTTLLGLQLLRSLVPYFTFLLRDRFEWSTPAAGLVALLIFLTAFLADPLSRFLGAVPAFLITAIAVGFTRLALQFWRFDPVGDFLMAASGVIAFLLFLPLTLGLFRRLEENSNQNLGVALLLGFASDLALNGAFLSYDLSWQSGWLPTLLVALLVAVQFVFISRLLNQELPSETADALFNTAIAWLAIGPYIFLQLLIFSNIAWATTSTGLSFPGAFMLLLAAQLFGLAAILLPPHIYRLAVSFCTVSALILTIIFLLSGTQLPWLSIIFILIGQIGVAGILLLVTSNLSTGRRLRGLKNISIANGLGMLILVIFLFAYYAVYDLSLPFSNSILPFLALLSMLLAAWPIWGEPVPVVRVDLTTATRVLPVMLLLMIIPIIQWITWQEPETINLNGGPVRIVNYNLHNGGDPKGHLGLEALAAVIESENADVVGIQEVSRGWVINGSADMLTWLSQRLGMTAIWGPTADGQWGNAILTRLPVLEYENRPLPTAELLLQRGYMVVRLDRGNGETLNYINTHYHHKEGEGDIRLQQSLEILGYWGERPSTIISGDLNAEHGEPEIDIFFQAGFRDVLDLTGVEPGYTYPAANPDRRIDYVWITPDIQPTTAVIPPIAASDHLPVGATLD
jgi:endonuclease/exonuclease/phosphatase family metal-dependent hydrolase